MKGLVLILSGPSGSGKSSLLNMLFSKIDNYYFSISTTTREPRENEVDGRDYFFTTKEKFQNDIKDNAFLEYAVVHNYYYGTSLAQIQQAVNNNKLVILDIDVQGKEQIITSKIKHLCTSVFVTTPLQSKLKERLQTRGTDSNETINTRIQNAKNEMNHIKDYDYLLINNELEQTFEHLMNIINTMSHRVKQNKIDEFINNWAH